MRSIVHISNFVVNINLIIILIFMFSLLCIDWVGSLYANQIFICLCIKSSIGTQGEIGRLKKCFNPAPSVVYSTCHSKAVAPVLVLLFVALRIILRGDLFKVLPCVVLVFFSHYSIAITSLGEKKAILSVFCTFVWFALVLVCLFPLPHGVW